MLTDSPQHKNLLYEYNPETKRYNRYQELRTCIKL